ncbi:Ribonuclease T2 [Cichlidogyrus casuarinus]|uniref:Ribonuclease T2 n=1 Tax=Cichlidogyrus casuarinus TaxID=1844966 RepID=A0ABD2QC64_9PLAT
MQFRLILISTLVALSMADPDWDYMVFSQEWPPTFCMDKQCKIAKKDFNIHGLWPSKYSHEQVSDCQGAPPFDAQNLIPIRSKLDLEWSDLFGKSDPTQFWEHEWDKHGTCAIEDDKIKTELNYFGVGLAIKQQVDTLNHLAKIQVTPSSNSYEVSPNFEMQSSL